MHLTEHFTTSIALSFVLSRPETPDPWIARLPNGEMFGWGIHAVFLLWFIVLLDAGGKATAIYIVSNHRTFEVPPSLLMFLSFFLSKDKKTSGVLENLLYKWSRAAHFNN